MTLEISANYSQKKLLSLNKKFRAFVGGFGSGKTYAGCLSQMVHFHMWPGIPQAYFAPTYRDIKDVYWPTIEEVAHIYGLRTDIKVGDHEVHLYRGPWYYGHVKCRSMDDPGSIVGFKVGRAMVDEFDILPLAKGELAWRKIIARLRYRRDGHINGIDVTTTPEGFNGVYKLFVEDIVKKPELLQYYGIIQASTFENVANLPPDYISSLVATYPAELIKAYINGEFTNLKSGTIYYAFDRNRHNSKEGIFLNDTLHIGMDFNVGKMAARVFVERGAEEWHCVDEIADVFDTPAMINIIKGRYRNKNIIIYPDVTGKNRETVNASQSDISLLEDEGWDIEVNSTNPRVTDSILAVNKRFQTGKCFVNTMHCPRTAKDLEQQIYVNGEPDKKSGHDHGNDAFRYPITYRFPIVRPLTKLGSIV